MGRGTAVEKLGMDIHWCGGTKYRRSSRAKITQLYLKGRCHSKLLFLFHELRLKPHLQYHKYAREMLIQHGRNCGINLKLKAKIHAQIHSDDRTVHFKPFLYIKKIPLHTENLKALDVRRHVTHPSVCCVVWGALATLLTASGGRTLFPMAFQPRGTNEPATLCGFY